MTEIDAFNALSDYCQEQHFKGWDPYDGLNSTLFRAIPGARRSALLRLCVIQGFKRSPVNLRRLALVPKQYNAKGVALALHAYANLADTLKACPGLQEQLGDRADAIQTCRELADTLVLLQSVGDYHGSCWGYNFDWQARRLFLFPAGTPTVVATTFAASALFAAHHATGDRSYLQTALSAADFVLHDLHRTPCGDGFLFSYSPLPGNDTVYNASLLGSKLLSLCYRHSRNRQYLELARQSVAACCEAQRDDGAWVYGRLPVQAWVDSFHTGYNLEALATYQQCTGDDSFVHHAEKGLAYYLEHFFDADGSPNYYDNRKYPIDIHCPAQLFVTLSALRQFERHKQLAQSVLNWTNANMRDRRGYYYYQLKRGISSKISYMRWSNAFMLYALSHYIKAKNSLPGVADARLVPNRAKA